MGSISRTVRLAAALLAAALTALAALPAIAPGAARSGQRSEIVGGTDATDPGWAPLAYVTTDVGGDHAIACSGTVVAPGAVLTAAHCVTRRDGTPYDPGAVTVVTGRRDLRDGAGRLHGAVQVLVHPAFDAAGVRFDAALIGLDSAAETPAIALAAGDPAAGTVGLVAGWGTIDGAGGVSSMLRSTATTVVANSACARRLGGFDAATMLCAIDGAQLLGSVCHGDSGGPLAQRRGDGSLIQIGITSWGTDGCDPRIPQVFTRMSAIGGWLAATVPGIAAPQAAPSDGTVVDDAAASAGSGDGSVPVATGHARSGAASRPAVARRVAPRPKTCPARAARGAARGARGAPGAARPSARTAAARRARRRPARSTRCARRATARKRKTAAARKHN